MKLTIRKTLLFSLALFFILAIAALAVTFLRVNRTVMVDGVFDYRETYPLTVEEPGFVQDLPVEKDSWVEKGDVVVALSNRDLEKEIADMERRLSMSAVELDSLERQESLARFTAAQDELSLEEMLKTKKLESEYRQGLHQMNRELYQAGSLTKERYEASQLTFRSAQGAVTEIEIQLRKSRRKLAELTAGPGTSLALKRRVLEIDRKNLEYMRSRQANLLIRAPESGVLLAVTWDSLKNTYLGKGTHFADIVSFDDINFVGHAKDTDIIRIKEGQKTYFDVEIFRRKIFVNGTVTNIGYKAVPGLNGFNQFPITIEVDNKKFLDRNQEFYIQAGVRGQAVIIVEEELSLITLVWEKILDFVDFGVYTE